tara:strand:- start:2059 stop:3948 length:1890 start_codon:yes stop_codon:yes gene_type:complete
MADTMALENPEESFQSTDTLEENPALGSGEVVPSPMNGDEKQVTSWMDSTGVSNFLAQPLVRRTIPALVGLFALLLFLLVYYWLNAEGSRTLYPNMSEVDRSEAFAQLQSANIPVSINQSTGTLMVPDSQYYEARMLLAASGLPSDGSSQSLDSLTSASSMTTSQFMEQAQYVAAIESEIAKSVMRISTIETARVHLAAPRQSSYIRNRQPAKASVIVETYPGRVVSPSQVQAIINLVASSVPYLSIDDVSVVDQMGTLLSDQEESGLIEATEQAAFKRNLEEQYHNKVMNLLSPIVGENNVRSDVDVTLDFSEFESTSEIFDRNGTGPSTRSEMLALDTSANVPAEGVPGETTNVAPQDTVLVDANTVANELDPSSIRSSQTTRNYEVDREIQYQRSSTGEITRLSVAVVLNRDAISEMTLGNGDGDDTYDVSGIQNLVASAVGIDESRGDSIMVLVSQFRDDAAPPVTWYESESIRYWANLVALLLGAVAFLLFVVRPIIYGVSVKTPDASEVKLLKTSDEESDTDEIETLSEDQVEEAGGIREIYRDGERVLRGESEIKARAEETGETLEEIKARLRPRKSNVSADMFDTANTYDDKVAIVRMLVDEDASRVASLLKKMVGQKSVS